MRVLSRPSSGGELGASTSLAAPARIPACTLGVQPQASHFSSATGGRAAASPGAPSCAGARARTHSAAGRARELQGTCNWRARGAAIDLIDAFLH